VVPVQEKKEVIIENKIIEKLSPRQIWGKLVSVLRQNNCMTLYTTCGELRDFVFENNTFNVYVKEDFIYELLIKEGNFQKLNAFLKEIEPNINLKFIYQKKKEKNNQINLQKLQKIFGDNLKIE